MLYIWDISKQINHVVIIFRRTKRIGIPDHLTCLLRNLHTGQEAKFELDMEQQTGSK